MTALKNKAGTSRDLSQLVAMNETLGLDVGNQFGNRGDLQTFKSRPPFRRDRVPQPPITNLMAPSAELSGQSPIRAGGSYNVGVRSHSRLIANRYGKVKPFAFANRVVTALKQTATFDQWSTCSPPQLLKIRT